MPSAKFISHLKVDKKIVSLLSRSTYQKSFSAAIRELISNAYDADALTVKIKHDQAFSYIEIEDDGNGMTRAEFDKYLTIAGTKNDRAGNRSRKYKREKIGQFGVGFLSIFPFCESLEITTTVENSSDVINAEIPTKNFFSDAESQRVEEVPIVGVISQKPGSTLDHFTRVRLINPTFLVRQYFKEADPTKKASIQSKEPADRFRWELQEDLPINLDPTSKYFDKYRYKEPTSLSVLINGKPLYRNEYLKFVLDEGIFTVDEITCRYIFTSDYQSIKPQEFRGIKIRVNNVGIGARTEFNLKRDRGFSRLHWITGEAFLTNNVKEHLSISRDSFISNPITDAIFENLAERLRVAANNVEAVAVAEKELQQLSTNTVSENVKSKKEIVAQNLKKLESRGFEIVEVKDEPKKSSNSTQPIKIDKEAKVVYVSSTAEEAIETTIVAGKRYTIKYSSWSLSDEQPAIKLSAGNVLKINQNYPYFKSRSLGNAFKQLHIILATQQAGASDVDDFYRRINKELLNQKDNII